MSREAGGFTVSLAGQKGDQGRSGSHFAQVLPAAAWIQVLPPNPKRVWCDIRFDDAGVGSNCFIALDTTLVGGLAKLFDGDLWEIDTLTPWTGAVYAYLNAGGASGETIDVTEVENATLST